MTKAKGRSDRFEPGLSNYYDLVLEGQTLELSARGRVVLSKIWLQTLLRTRRYPNAGVVVNGEKAARWMQVEPEALRSVVTELRGLALA